MVATPGTFTDITRSFRVLEGGLQVSIRGERRTLAVGEEESGPAGTLPPGTAAVLNQRD
jgi:hypothetical protein